MTKYPDNNSIHGSKNENKQVKRNHIRWGIRKDIPEILNIENQSYEHPWSEEDFIRCLRQRNCISMVSENKYSDKVEGYMIYELHKQRLHLLKLAVDPEFRNQGLGSQMIEKLKGKLSHKRRTSILLEVSERNLPAQLFFRDQDFRAISVLRDYYEDSNEDSYLMNYRLKTSAESELGYLPMNHISRLLG